MVKPMTLTWYGHSCFRLDTAEGSAVFDPYSPGSVPGLSLPELTADAAVMLLEQRGALPERRVLVSGFGRIGSALAQRLRARGAAVTVAARSEQARSAAERMDCRAVPIGAAPGYDFVVNTVPSVIFGANEIAAFGDAELIELASAPYGFDLPAARAAGTLRAMAIMPMAPMMLMAQAMGIFMKRKRKSSAKAMRPRRWASLNLFSMPA